MTGPGEILLVACYELGHQPLAVAWPAAFLERACYRPAVMDLSVEPFDADKVRRARLVAVAVPMRTALRVGAAAASRVRAANPAAHVCFYGHYAALNAEHLLGERHADSVLAGELEDALVALARRLDDPARPPRVSLGKLDFPLPARAALPALKKYAHLDREDAAHLVGYVEASRGCKHGCRHCPIPPVYGRRFFVVPRAGPCGRRGWRSRRGRRSRATARGWTSSGAKTWSTPPTRCNTRCGCSCRRARGCWSTRRCVRTWADSSPTPSITNGRIPICGWRRCSRRSRPRSTSPPTDARTWR